MNHMNVNFASMTYTEKVCLGMQFNSVANIVSSPLTAFTVGFLAVTNNNPVAMLKMEDTRISHISVQLFIG
jgi:hypothetical protein